MLNLLLTDESGAPATAREALRNGNGMLPDGIRDDVLLLVSELVTNAVRHAGAGPDRPLQLQLLRGPRWVVVTVGDEGPGFTWHPASARRQRVGWLGALPRGPDRGQLGRRVHGVRDPRLVRDRVRRMTVAVQATRAASATLPAIGGLHMAWGLGYVPAPYRPQRPAPRGLFRGSPGFLGAAAGLVAGRPRRAPRAQL